MQRQERVCEPLSAAHASGQAAMSEHLPGVDVIFRDDTWRQNRDRMDYLADADGKTINYPGGVQHQGP